MQSRFEQFSAVISGINRYLQNIEREEMIKIGFKGGYAIYLVTMKRYPEGITSAELGEYCVKDKAAVSRTVAQMESDGLVRREAVGDSLYRARLLLTDRGNAVAEFVTQRVQSAVREVTADLSEDKRQIMYEYLNEVCERLENISEKGIPE